MNSYLKYCIMFHIFTFFWIFEASISIEFEILFTKMNILLIILHTSLLMSHYMSMAKKTDTDDLDELDTNYVDHNEYDDAPEPEKPKGMFFSNKPHLLSSWLCLLSTRTRIGCCFINKFITKKNKCKVHNIYLCQDYLYFKEEWQVSIHGWP